MALHDAELQVDLQILGRDAMLPNVVASDAAHDPNAPDVPSAELEVASCSQQ